MWDQLTQWTCSVVGFGCAALLVAATARGDDEADSRMRGAALMSSLPSDGAGLLLTQLIGIAQDGQPIGSMRLELGARNTDGGPPRYLYSMRSRQRFANGNLVWQDDVAEEGVLNERMQVIELTGTEAGLGRDKKYTCRRRDGDVWVSTISALGPTAMSRETTGVDSTNAIVFLLARLWLKLPERQAHSFNLLEPALGSATRLSITRVGDSQVTLDGRNRGVVDIAVTSDVAGPVLTLRLDPATGHIVEIVRHGVKDGYSMREIAPGALGRWEEAAGLGPDATK